MATLRTDRLAMLTDDLADAIAALDPTPFLDPRLAAVLKLARAARIDVTAILQDIATNFLRSLPASAESDPLRAASAAEWAAETLAWLRDEREDPPAPINLGL